MGREWRVGRGRYGSLLEATDLSCPQQTDTARPWKRWPSGSQGWDAVDGNGLRTSDKEEVAGFEAC